MDKNLFVNGLNTYIKSIEFLEALDDIGLNLYESPLSTSNDSLFDIWINTFVTNDGSDLIYWWLFEDVDKVIYKDDKVVATLETVEDLFDYMLSNNYFTA